MPLKIWIILILLAPGLASAQGRPRLSIDTILYPYQSKVENDTDLTFVINARLPAKFSYFSYLNFRGATTGDSFDFSRSEQNLRWSIADALPIDLSLQAVLADGAGNDFTQLGISWRAHSTPGLVEFFERISLVYRLTFQLKRFGSSDDNAWQTEQFFKMTFPGLSERLYLSGFIDQTYNLDVPDAMPKHPIVAEVQGGLRIWKQIYVVGEYRRNDFRVGRENNFAAGIEFKYALR
jgi:hypothetical protein